MPDVEYLRANGLRFAFFDEGEGPLVLLLHGFPDTPHTWDGVRPALVERGYRAVSPFMRGYAPTEVPDSPPTPETLAGDVVGLIEACGADSAMVVGHDWGAFAAYAAAALAPERIDRLFTVAIPHPAAVLPTPSLVWAVRHFLALNLPGATWRVRRNDFAYLEKLIRRWSPNWAFDEADLAPIKESLRDNESTEAAVSYYRMLRRPPSTLLRRGRIRVPTTVVAGLDETHFLPLSVFEDAERHFEDTYQVVPLSGGHFVHRECTEEFNDTLLTWLDDECGV